MSIAEMIRSADKFKSELRAAKEFDFVEHPSDLPPDLIDACVAVVMAERRAGLEWPLDALQSPEYDAADDSVKSYYAAIEAKRLRGDAEPVDAVNHPPHYNNHPSGVECIKITEHMNFCRGNAVKYIWRADDKGNVIENLEKAKWYLEREIARLKAISA